MKLFIACLLVITLISCTTPATAPPETVTQPPEEETSEPTGETPVVPETTEPVETKTEAEPPAPETITLKDYFPNLTDVVRHFDGVGNEFAAYTEWTEYTEENLMQFHSRNAGSEIVKVIEVSPNEVKQVYASPETYYRENQLKSRSSETEKILLQAPLEIGHSWTNPDGSKLSITGVDVEVEILQGETVLALEVTSDDGMKYYYAPKFGLVKTDFQEGMVTQTLSEFKTNTAYEETITLYLPNDQVTALDAVEERVPLKTNAIVREEIAKLLKRPIPNGLGLPSDFSINSLYRNHQDGRAYLDVNQAIYQWNVGSGVEALGIEGLIKTVGHYLQTDQVYFWVDGEGYSSGHLEFGKNTPLWTDSKNQ